MSSLSGSGSQRRGPNGYFETVMPMQDPADFACPLSANDSLLLKYALSGNTAGLCECLDAGGNPNIQNDDSKQNALMIALVAGHIDCVKFLAYHPQMNLRAKDYNGEEAWMLAARAKNPDCMEALARACRARQTYDPSVLGWELVKSQRSSDALMVAIHSGCVKSAQVALDYDADTKSANDVGMTKLMWAAISGDTDMVDLALPGSNPKAKDKHGETALMMSAFKGFTAGVIKLLPLSDPQELNLSGLNALMLACIKGNENCVRELAPYTANSFMELGDSALARCIRKDYASCMVALIETHLAGTHALSAQMLVWGQVWGQADFAGAKACVFEARERAQSLAQRLDLELALRTDGIAGATSSGRL